MSVLPPFVSVNHVCAWCHRSQKKVSDPLGLGLYSLAAMWMLGIESPALCKSSQCPYLLSRLSSLYEQFLIWFCLSHLVSTSLQSQIVCSHAIVKLHSCFPPQSRFLLPRSAYPPDLSSAPAFPEGKLCPASAIGFVNVKINWSKVW